MYCVRASMRIVEYLKFDNRMQLQNKTYCFSGNFFRTNKYKTT